jgi:hypothetical protein
VTVGVVWAELEHRSPIRGIASSFLLAMTRGGKDMVVKREGKKEIKKFYEKIKDFLTISSNT